MSRREIVAVCELAAHLAMRTDTGTKTYEAAPKCASDAMRLQRLGRRARRNAEKRWLDPGLREAMPDYDVQPYLEECGMITREVERILAPYGLYPRDFSVGIMGVVFLTLPGDYVSMFGKGFLI